jgi:hypothetical protein
MEEIFLSKLSLENITAHLYSCPGCGCNNFYICERDAAMLAYHAHCWTFRLLPAPPQEACLALIMRNVLAGDYTKEKTRDFWANGTATMYNSAGESQCCHQDSAPRHLLLALLAAAAIICATATVETVSHRLFVWWVAVFRRGS